MTIGITGASGFLGAVLALHLEESRKENDRIVPFYSRRPGNPLTDHLSLRYQQLDVTSEDDVRRKVRDMDVLYHVAGAVDYARQNRRRTWDVNVIGTRNVLEAALAQGVGTIVCVSSTSVLGAPAGGAGLADETNDRYAPGLNPLSFASPDEARGAVAQSLRGDYRFLSHITVPYFDSKLAAFEIIMDRARGARSRVVVVLPGTAVGAGDTAMAIGGLVQRIADGRIAFTLPGGTSFVSAPDVARGMRLAAARGRSGEAYILTGDEEDNLHYAEFMTLVARVARESFGKKPPRRFLTVPAAAAPFVGGIAEVFSPRGAFNRGLAISGSVTHRFSAAKARKELGYATGVSLEESIRACIDFNLHMIGRTLS